MEHLSVSLLLFLACSLPACCWAFTCFEGTGCGGDSRPEATRKGDCCAGVGLSFMDPDAEQCFECFSEASFTGGGSEFYLAFFNNLFPGPFFSRAGARLSIGAVGEGVGQNGVRFMVESSKDQIEGETGLGGTPTEVSLDTDIRLTNVRERDEGVCVRSVDGQDLSVVAYGEEFTSADTFKVLPCVFLPNREYEYFVVSVQTTTPDPDLGFIRERSAFAVVASEDETTLTLNLTQRIDISSAPDLIAQIGSQVIEAGEPVTVTLNRMQSLYISSVLDLTGSRVVTNKPVSFIVGHECGNIPFDATFCDQMVEQIPPTATWGFNFLSAPIADRTGIDIFKAVPSRSSGSFRGNCTGGPQPRDIVVTFQQAGQPEEFQIPSDEYCTFTSDIPVLLLQFSTGTAVDNVTDADPFMVIVPPTEQYQNSYQLPTFVSQSTPGTNFLNIFVPAFVDRNQVFLDGQQVTELLPGEWVVVPCEFVGVCSLAQLEVSNETHVLSHTNPNDVIGVIAYWLAFRAGHGYVGGMTQRPIALPRVSFGSVDDVSVFEAEESFTIQLILDGFVEAEQDIEVFIRSRDGSAIAGEDYDAINTSITVEGDVGLQFIGTLTPDDVFPEANKSFEIFMTASPGVYLTPNTIITVTIMNDDPPLPVVNISFAQTQITVREGEGIVQFRLLKSDDASVPGGRGIVRVMLTTADGSAFGAPFGMGDYQPLDVEVAFDVEDTEQIVTTTITDNDRLEGVESFTATIVALESLFPVAVVMNATVTVDIVDDDIVVVGFDPPLHRLVEGSRSVSVAVRLFGATDVAFSVTMTSMNVDAIAGEDYQAVNATLLFGVQSPPTQAVVVRILGDDQVEQSELFLLRLGTEQSAVSDSIRLIPDRANVLIEDNDRLVVGLDGPSEVEVDEGESVVVTVRVLQGELEQGTESELVVGLSAVGRTALAGLDFQEIINMELVFTSGTSSRMVQIPTTDDETFEEEEMFVILLTLLSTPGAGELSTTRDVVEVTILDDDVLGSEFQCYQTADCTGNPIVTQTIEACCTTNGVSFQQQGGVNLCKPCILVGFSEPVYNLRERELPYTLTVTVVQGGFLPQSLPLTVTAVPFTASPSDFNLLTPEIALLSDSRPLQAEVRISLPQEPLVDNDDLSVESLTLLLNDGLELAPANVFFRMSLVNILDTVVRISFAQESYSVLEGQVRGISLVVSSNGFNDAPIQVLVTLTPGTAQPITDYIAGNQTILTFPPGSTQQSLSISIINDNILEMTEQFTARLSLVSGGAIITQDPATIIITDNDFVILEFNQSTYRVREGGETSVTVVRRGASEVTQTFSVTVNSQDGTATANSEDYLRVSTTLQLPPNTGDTAVAFTIEASSDSRIEGEETFFLLLSEPSEGARLGRSNATVIIEDFSLTVGFEETSYTVAEGGDAMLVCAILTPSFDRNIFVEVVSLDGTAVGGEDYSAVSATLTFTAGNSRTCVQIVAQPDLILEPSETFELSITQGTSGVILEPSTATVFITDQTLVPIGFEQTLHTVTEGVDPFVELCAIVLGNVQLERDALVSFATRDNTATSIAPVDFGGAAVDFTFGPGVSRLCVEVTIEDDDILEDEEDFFGTLTTTDPGVTLSPDLILVIIREDSFDGVVIGFEQTVTTVQETDASVELCAVLIEGTLEREAVVTFSTSDGTATSGEPADYDSTTAALTFDPSNTRQCVTVGIVDDDIALEGAEDFFTNLDTTDPGVIVDSDSAQVFIESEDSVTVEFEFPNYTVLETSGSVTVCAITSTGVARFLTIASQATAKMTSNAATPGEDFVPDNRNFIFPPSTTGSRVCNSFEILDDFILENPEQFNVDLILPSFIGLSPGVNEEACVVIEDDERGVLIGFDQSRYTVFEGSTVEVCVRVLEGGLGREGVVTVFTQDSPGSNIRAGINYSPIRSDLTLDSQNPQRCVNISTIDDPCVADFVFFEVVFTTDDESLDFFDSTATVDIFDPTDRVAIGFEMAEYSFQEDDGTVEVCATLEDGCFNDRAFEVLSGFVTAGTATDGVDYMVPFAFTPLRFDNSTTRACISIVIVDDTEPEGVEFFFANFGTPTSRVQVTQNTTRINIIDNDPPVGLMCFTTAECNEPFSLVDNITECCGARSNYYRRGSTCTPCAVSSAGSDFSIGFLQNFPPPDFLVGGADNITFVFTTPELEPVSIAVSAGPDFQRTLTVPPGESASLVLPPSIRVEDALDRNKGVRILTENGGTVSVYGSNAQLFSVAGFHAIPCAPPLPVDTYEFYAVSVPAGNMTNNSAFLVVACEDNTVVTFTPTQVVGDPGNRQLFIQAGESRTVTLNQAETLYISSREDLTGSRVVADKQVSFFSGHECAEVPAEMGDCDHLVEQIPPTALWGLYFLTAPIANRSVSYIARIVASEPDTGVGVFCDGINTFFDNLNPGDAPFVSNISIEGYCYIGATKPILFVQFTPGNTNVDDVLVSGAGDPFMIVIPANNHYARSITLATLEGQLQFQTFVNVFTLPLFFDPENILLDGSTISTWVAISCEGTSDVCGYAAQVEIPPGAHTIVHRNELGRVGVIVYGLSFLESYGYVGGLELGLPELPVTIGIPQQNHEVLESDEEVAINIVVIVGELQRDVTLSFIPEDGTAIGLMDYDPTVLSNLILTPNMTQLTIRIPIINDNIAEATEHFTGRLVSNDVLIVLGTTRIDILDDDIDQSAATNVGGEFYIGFIPNYSVLDGSDSRDASVFIVPMENETQTVDIDGRGVDESLRVNPGAVASRTFLSNVANATDRLGGIQIQVQSMGRVAAFGANPELLSLGGFLALPCPQQLNVDQYEYYAVTVPPTQELSVEGGFLVVSCSGDTLVTITPSQPIQDPNNLREMVPAGGTTTVTLADSGQTVYIASRDFDLTGSRVVSNNPISFFTGHQCAVPNDDSFDCDHIIEQMPPTATWGTTFLTAPIRTQAITFGNDIFKMVASRIHTTINVTCITSPGATTRNFVVNLRLNGDFADFTVFNEFCSIEADKPIMVVQVSTNRGEGTGLMSLIPATSQYRNDIIFSVISLSDSNLEQWANIFVPPQFFQPRNITLNGIPLPDDGWTGIPCNSGGICGYARQQVISGIGVQSLQHENQDAVFGVIVYGHTLTEGYGYPGGLQLPMTDPPECDDGDVRLENGDPATGSGRVGICFGGEWGTVCNDNWDISDARVVCRQLGLETQNAIAVTNTIQFGEGTGPIFLDEVACSGSEARLEDCGSNEIGDSNCDHSEDAGVVCMP